MEIEKLFKKPPREYRDLVLWSVSGWFNANEIKRQLECFATMGYGGVCIKSGVGLKVDYNGEGWIEILKTAISECKRLGLSVYLCDDDAFAFGTGGGLATMNPRFRAKSFVCNILPSAEFSFANYKNEFISAYGIRLIKENGEDRLAYYYTINNSSEIRKGDDIMVITVEEDPVQVRYNGSYPADMLSEDAFAYFTSLRLAKYKEVFANEFSHTVKGIFTSDCMVDYSIKTDCGKQRRPYSEQLANEFVSEYGYRLLPRLPEIFYTQAGADFSPTALKYAAIVKSMFEKNRLLPYAKWCRENGLEFMGALGMFDSPVQGTVGSDRLRTLEKFDSPTLYASDLNTPVIKYEQLASVCHQTGKRAHLACFWNTDRSVNFSQYKNEMDVQTYFGVARKIYCSAHYSIEEHGKRMGTSFSYQMSSYREFKILTDYSARQNVLNSTSKPMTSVLVVYGEESADGKRRADEERESLNDICGVLVGYDVDFDIVSEDALALAKESRFGKNARITVGEQDYTTVIICGATTLRSSTVNALTRFAKRGGNCVFAGVLPSRIDGNETDFKKLPIYEYSKVRKVDEGVLDGISKPLNLVVDDENGNVSIKVRKADYGYYLFALNKNKDARVRVGITVDGEFFPAKFDLCSGKLKRVASLVQGDKTSVELELEPAGELALGLFSAEPEHVEQDKKEIVSREKIAIPASVEYRLSEFNVLVLDVATVTVDGQNLGKAEILSCAAFLREKYGLTQRGGIQPWFNDRILKKDSKEKVAELKLSYSFYIETKPLKLKLALEKPECFEITLNGRRVNMQKDGLFVDNALEKLHIPSTYIREGRNELILSCALCDDIPLEPLYLLGNFGVRVIRTEGDFDKYEITELPQKLTFADVCSQGLPFYGGKIYYYLPLEKGEYQIKFDRHNTWDYAKLRTKDDSKTVAFYPFEGTIKADIAERDYERYESLGEVAIFEAPEIEGVQIELALTRRNTFGPLHTVSRLKKSGNEYKRVTEFERSALLERSGIGEIVVKKLS